MKKALSHYLARDLVGLLLVFLGVFTIVAELGAGGTIGHSLSLLSTELLGLAKYLAAALTGFLGILTIIERELKRKIELIFAAFLLFFNLTVYTQLLGHGGILGAKFLTLQTTLGLSGLLLLTVILDVIALCLLFAKSLRDLVAGFHSLLSAFATGLRRGKPLDLIQGKPFGSAQDKQPEVKILGQNQETKKTKTEDDDEPEVSSFEKNKDKKTKDEEIKVKRPRLKSHYALPPISLLEKKDEVPESGDIRTNVQIIKRTLATFGISIEVETITIGPTITRYGIKLAEGVKLAKLLALQNDLALNLAAGTIRIEPITGKSLVGIEVMNRKVARVRLRNLVEEPAFSEAESLLEIPMGRQIAGEPFYADLALMPHLLIAGTTGSGKSMFIHSIITTLLLRNTPETLNFIMIDPKRVELVRYENLPHLVMDPVLDTKKAIAVMQWLIREMEERFLVLQQHRARDLDSYNKLALKNSKPLLSRIVLFIDEMADLMLTHGASLEASIVRLTQMARATGIHLVLSTQRPSVDVVTGLIKANVPNRVCFKVASQIDSRTVLDFAGAEKLVGLGDALTVGTRFVGARRFQAPLAGETEINRIAQFWQNQAEEVEEEKGEVAPRRVSLEELVHQRSDAEVEGDAGDDEMFRQAYRIVVDTGKASTSLLQRKLRIGYGRAARLLDLLEDKGIVGPADGSKPRQILVDRDDTGKETPEL